MGNGSDIHGKKRLKAYFKASLLALRDTYGSESNGLAGTQVAAFERQEWISWDPAKVSSWPVSTKPILCLFRNQSILVYAVLLVTL